MHIVLIADTFPPLRTSGAVQLRDLSHEFIRQGHSLTVLLPSPNQKDDWLLENVKGVRILRLRAPKTKGIGYFRRTVGEMLMPFFMLRRLKKSPLAREYWDGVVWYSPSIFHGPLISSIKKASNCKSYLIIRDIFPEWALDMGLIGYRLPYLFFRAIALYQYSIANIIGVQTQGNLAYFERWKRHPNRKLEVLKNWLDSPVDLRCSIRVNETPIAGRKIFVYAGNMGVAQGMDIFIDLAEKLQSQTDVGFLFVGCGDDVARLKSKVQERKIFNTLFFDEIHPDEIPDLYRQCSAGIVALDPRHKTHNIPGKFLTYMQSGLPVLANINQGNDLAKIIFAERVGQVCESNRVDDLLMLLNKLLLQIEADCNLSIRCKSLFEREFAVEKPVRQIISALSD